MLLKWFIQFVLGIGVGIYGYLNPGFINLQIFHLATKHHATHLWQVIFIIALVEIPYCFFCMSAMNWLMSQQWLLQVIQWLIVVFLLAMALFVFLHMNKKNTEEEGSTKVVSMSKLLVFAIFNPFQLSAWTIWGAYFIEKTWFDWSMGSIAIFSIGASIGVFIILRLYAIAGNRLITYFKNNKKVIDYAVIALVLILALVQLVKNISTLS